MIEFAGSTFAILIMVSGAYCLWEQTRYEQKEWEKRRDERKRNH